MKHLALAAWGMFVLVLACMALSAHAGNARAWETKQWCRVYAHYFAPKPGYRLRSDCAFVRYDNLAREDLYKVWLTISGPRRTRVAFACVWFDGGQETNYVWVPRVGAQAGVLC